VVVDDEDVRSIVVGWDLRRGHTSLRRRRAMSLGRRPPRADQLQDPLAVRGLDHREQERDGVVFTKRAEALRGAGKSPRLHTSELARQLLPLRSNIKLAMAPIQRSGPRLYEILGDQ